MQSDLFHYKVTLHVSGVTAPIVRSTKNCNRILWYRSWYRYSYFPPTWPDWDWFVWQTSPYLANYYDLVLCIQQSQSGHVGGK